MVDKDDIETFETDETLEYDNYPEGESGECGSKKKSATITLPDGINYSDGKRQYTNIKNNKYKKGDRTSQEALVKRFQKLLGDNGNGTTENEVRNGINRYLKSIGKKGTCKYISKYNVIHSVITKIKNRINNKRPCIVRLEREPKYGNHWVVGIGYASYYGINGHSRGYVHFVKINDGWGKSFLQSVVYVNYNYIDGVIYFK